ncbi:glutathione S-transferase, partial [Hafnia alvei]
YNPLGKIPALVTADGEIVYDSPIVAEYIDLLDAAPKFVPEDRQQALRVRQLEALSDGICDAAVLLVQEMMRPADKQNSDWIVRQRGKIDRGLDALEQHAKEGKWLNGAQMTLADIATGCCLGYLNFRRVAPNWSLERPELVKLAERLFQRESFTRTEPPVT